MTSKVLGGIIAAILGITVMCGLGAAALFGGGAAGCTVPVSNATVSAPAGGWPPVGTYTPDQVGMAAIIVSVGEQMNIPVRGWVIAVATAIQESHLSNLTGGNQDSIGLFQQRPSQGWGTPQQLRDPVYASQKFYAALLTVPGWQDLSLTNAAQTVQHSAFPDAYAQWENDATTLINAVGSANWRAIPENLEQCMSTCPAASGTSSSPGTQDGCPASEAVLARAATWLAAWNGGPVPYLSTGDPNSWFGGYRRDCSGYASMALGLTGPGLTTAGLAAHATRISKTALGPGDLLINPAPNLAGHVVIFDHWTDPTMTSYIGYEQSGDGGTHHRVIPYPYFGNYQMSPYHWINR